jgi:hypothetical protein
VSSSSGRCRCAGTNRASDGSTAGAGEHGWGKLGEKLPRLTGGAMLHGLRVAGWRFGWSGSGGVRPAKVIRKDFDNLIKDFPLLQNGNKF